VPELLRAGEQAVLQVQVLLRELPLRELQQELLQAEVQVELQVLRMPFRIRRRKQLHRGFLYRNWDKTCFISFPRARKPDKHDRFIVSQVFIYKIPTKCLYWQFGGYI
jgi:hypothetical protein